MNYTLRNDLASRIFGHVITEMILSDADGQSENKVKEIAKKAITLSTFFMESLTEVSATERAEKLRRA